MGEMADYLTDSGFEAESAHNRGQCEYGCQYCALHHFSRRAMPEESQDAMTTTHEELRQHLAGLDRAQLLYDTAVAVRHYLDCREDNGLCAVKDLCWIACGEPGREGIWDAAVKLAKAAGRYGVIPKQPTEESDMTTALANVSSLPSPEVLERLVIHGDLSKLTPAEKTQYYLSVCTALDLNPATQPFAYLTLNGKQILYARKECTEQLRKKHHVSVKIVARESVEGCYAVTAQARLPEGREDESIGAVAIEGLKGDARANAMMKAETKAKRRVTLSICGLGMLDETEVDSIPAAVTTSADHAHEDEPPPARKPTPRSQGGQHASPPTDEPREPAKMPATGQKLYEMLDKRDAELSGKGLFQRGDLLRHVGTTGISAGMPKNMGDWKPPHISIAVGMAKTFIEEAQLPKHDVSSNHANDEPPEDEQYAGKEIEEPATA